MNWEQYFLADFENGILFSNPDRPEDTFATNRAYRYWKTRYAGKPVGGKTPITSRNKTRYLRWKNGDKESYAVHRILWEMYHGKKIPSDMEIDHIDGNGLNNAIINLRAVSHSKNVKNVGLISTNKTGVKGVSFQKRYGVYIVSIFIEGKNKTVGRYKTVKEAKIARVEAEKKYWGEVA